MYIFCLTSYGLNFVLLYYFFLFESRFIQHQANAFIISRLVLKPRWPTALEGTYGIAAVGL